jgi:copper chaperone CopZ
MKNYVLFTLIIITVLILTACAGQETTGRQPGAYELIAESIAESLTEPITELFEEPITELFEEPVTELFAEPVPVVTELTVWGMVCTRCENKIITALLELDGVLNVSADNKADKVTVEYEPKVEIDTIKRAIRTAGFDID